MNVGLLVIATNKYIQFVEPLWESAKKHFMAGTGHDPHMFVFTDADAVPKGTLKVPHRHRPWPYPTLLRYHAFTDNESCLQDMDYVFYCDADMRFEGDVGEEILGDLVATIHPGFWDKQPEFFSQSYEKNPRSCAYMPPGMHGKHYYAGGFNGGRRERWLQMAREIRGWIDKDLENGIIAAWHDESHLNKYLTGNPPTVELDTSYCYQEELDMPFPRRLVALKKDHDKVRG